MLKNYLLGVEVARKFVKTYKKQHQLEENLVIAHRILLSVAATAAAAIPIADSAQSRRSSDNLRAERRAARVDRLSPGSPTVI